MSDKGDLSQKAEAMIAGLAVGDALGVPVEFLQRDTFVVTDMVEMPDAAYPVGTWSDDTSLTLALADNLNPEKFDLHPIAEAFVAWYDRARYTPCGVTFGVGDSTQRAIQKMRDAVALDRVGGTTERDNGNGSLMRIAPLAIYLADVGDVEKRFEIVKAVSSLTHAHEWSVAACMIFTEMLRKLISGQDKEIAYSDLRQEFTSTKLISAETLTKYRRILTEDIRTFSRDEISSTGFVVDTLEAAFWCFLTTDNYKSAVLQAVNLGFDADTIGAVTGAMSGLYYGKEAIPSAWLKRIIGLDEIEFIAYKLSPMQ